MTHWYFDEITMVKRMREIQHRADHSQGLGLDRRARSSWWQQFRVYLGQRLVALGQRLQQSEPVARTNLASTPQCGLR
ncbi:MAG TPA: hypothetical protein VLG48_13295 [Candidatus Methylomirabilis sp.]|nr:hypothetical protein [Candidatus Methylomirabilis sp.]